ncbi:unnamed protein product [Rotaria sp. Silwood1]|nr:unnamed protein product [Rotaria sp. Silwood1]CAF4594994.1 unnamed protein product [Rotaria sp. Silwood1]
MYLEGLTDDVTSVMNESLTIILSTKISNSTYQHSSLSPILTALSTKYTSLTEINNNMNLISSENQSTSFSLSSTSATSQKPPMTVAPYALVSYLVDQFNHYRNIDILSRIKQCNSNMNLDDMCETYSFDNHTYSLVRESNIGFQSLQHIYNALIDRIIVQKLNTLCSTAEWCLGNLTKYNIRFTVDVFRQLGHSFCSLESCYPRLQAHTKACPSISATNISKPTLALLPMLCTLYKEQQIWNSTECTDQVVYLLHILYAFWPQLETCYHVISAGSGGCTYDCLTFDSILHEVENQCHEKASFLTSVSTLAWYRLINLQQICRHETIATKPPFISSIKSFISSNMIWYRFHQRPVHAALFIIIVICIVISFSLCLYFMSNNGSDSNTRHFDDDYEYTRLHDSTFELGANTEISNRNSTSSGIENESQFGLNSNHHSSEEHQRLL